MANDHVTELRKHGTPQMKSRFSVILSAVDGVSKKDVELVSQRVTNISPVFEMLATAQPAPSKNSHWYYFDDDDVSPFTLTATEFSDMKTLAYFRAWRAMQINDDGTYNVKNHYEKSISVYLLDASYKNTLLEIKLKGCFIDRLALPDLSYEGSEPVSIEVNCTYDEIKFPPSSGVSE